jgi:hypothetical protein
VTCNLVKTPASPRKGETAIELLVLTPQEKRDVANYTNIPLAKVACLALAIKDRYVAFKVVGIDRYFATSPENIVQK